MTPRTKKRASLFPAYAPPEQPDLSLEEWATHLGGYIRSIAMRLAQIAMLLAAIGGGTAYVAKPTPSANDSAAIARIKTLEDTAAAHGKRLTALETKLDAVLYIGCRTLERVQPARAIAPQECR
jgi:hypothetical protein